MNAPILPPTPPMIGVESIFKELFLLLITFFRRLNFDPPKKESLLPPSKLGSVPVLTTAPQRAMMNGPEEKPNYF